MNKKKGILILFLILSFGIVGCGKEEQTTKEKTVIKNENAVVLKEKLNIEVNSEANILSLISDDNKTEITNKDEVIDTSILGEKEITIKYKKDNEEKEYKCKINIVDTVAPTIEYKETLTTTKGKKIDLLKGVTVKDNSKEQIKATVEGSYDINKTGNYKLKYVAIDSSGNKIEKDFTLKVNAKKTNSSSSVSNNTTNANTNTSNTTDNNSTSNTTTSNNTSNNNTSNSNTQTQTPPTPEPQKTCDLAKKQEIEDKCKETREKAEEVLATSTAKKNECLELLKVYGGYISETEYNLASKHTNSATEQATLTQRRGLSLSVEKWDDLIKKSEALIEDVNVSRVEMLKKINCL